MKAQDKGVGVNVENRIVFDVTPHTGDENLREIGAIGLLLVETIQEACGLSGLISVEKRINGVRISIALEKTVDSTWTLKEYE